MQLDNKIEMIIRQLETVGYDAFLVGGCVRDDLMQHSNQDYDIVTTASLEEIQKVFEAEHFVTYQKGCTIAMIDGKRLIDISTTNGKTIEEDLKRRDFTINTLLYHPQKGLVDLFHGQKDILQGIIRTSQAPDAILQEDPLRILRAIRFEGRLGFEIDSELLVSMNAHKELLRKVAPERIRDEFNKILMVSKPSTVIRKHLEIFNVFVPSLGKTKDFEQCNPYHEHTVLEHILQVLDATEENLILRLAAFFHDIEKPACFTKDERDIGHFYNHYTISADTAKEVMKKLHYPTKDIQRVYHLVLYHDTRLELKDKSLLKFLSVFGAEDLDLLFALKKADVIGQNSTMLDRLAGLDLIYQRLIYLIQEKKFITKEMLEINGRMLIQMGYPANASISKMLEQMLDEVRAGTLKNENVALSTYARQHLNVLKIKSQPPQ